MNGCFRIRAAFEKVKTKVNYRRGSKLNLHFVTSNQISTDRKSNLPLINKIYLVFSSLKYKRRLKQTKVCYYMLFLLCLRRRSDSQTFEWVSCKNLLPVCLLLRYMFFIPCDNRKTLYFVKSYRLLVYFVTVML